jgi:hypothetical protein
MKAHTIRGHVTFNQWVTGSNPVRLTTDINDLAGFCSFLTSLKSVLVALWWHKTGDYSFQILL